VIPADDIEKYDDDYEPPEKNGAKQWVQKNL
jgi:hypothetical protein